LKQKGYHIVAIEQAENSIEIPQFGTKHSLNVSVTSGIILWEVFKKLSIRKKIVDQKNV
jgi:tRNA G18 (ribose-2'-O)-methylase SpoU